MTLPLPPELPILPGPRERALVLLMNPDADLSAFTSVVEGDPSLTAGVLRAANSAMSWPTRPIRTASEAVIRLGATAVRHLITATLVRSQFASLEASNLDTDELWRHLLGAALLCEAQAKADGESRSVYFTAGLLHDLGRLAMAAQAPSRYREVVFEVQAGADANDVERFIFGTDHAEFGLRICERWRLPDEVAEAVALHHSPPGEAGDALTGLSAALATAREVMRGLEIGDGVQRPGDPRPEAAEHPLVLSLGGAQRFTTSIRWFREATRMRRDAAA